MSTNIVKLMGLESSWTYIGLGCSHFGPDGCLYVGASDFGPTEDLVGHSLDLNLLLGSTLRLDGD